MARALIAEIGLKADIDGGSPNTAGGRAPLGQRRGLLGVFTRRDEQGKGDREKRRVPAPPRAPQDSDEQEATDGVTLSTLHGARASSSTSSSSSAAKRAMPHARTLDARATDVASDGDGATTSRKSAASSTWA